MDTINENTTKYEKYIDKNKNNVLTRSDGDTAYKPGFEGYDIYKVNNENFQKFIEFHRRNSAIKTKNLNVLSGQTKMSTTYNNQYGTLKDYFLNNINEDTTYQEFSDKIINDINYDFIQYKSGNKAADSLARYSGINMEYKNQEYYPFKTLYSTESLGDREKYINEVDGEGTTKYLKRISELRHNLSETDADIERNSKISKIYRSKKDPNVLLIVGNRKFITTEKQFQEDLDRLEQYVNNR